MLTPARIYRYAPAALILVATLLALGFNSGPIFESPDEIQHYFYMRYLVTTGQLSDVYDLPNEWLGSEMFQPPLYYAVGALILGRINDADFEEVSQRKNTYHPNMTRQYASDGRPPLGNFNKNFFIHSIKEAFPYTASPTALAVHLLRLYSTLLGIGTLIFCAAIFHLIWPNHPHRQVMALAVAALWPLRVYMSATINNDN